MYWSSHPLPKAEKSMSSCEMESCWESKTHSEDVEAKILCEFVQQAVTLKIVLVACWRPTKGAVSGAGGFQPAAQSPCQ